MIARSKAHVPDHAEMEAAIRGLVDRDGRVGAENARVSAITQSVARGAAARVTERSGLEMLVSDKGFDASRRTHGMLLDHERGRQVVVTGSVDGADASVAVDGRVAATVPLTGDPSCSDLERVVALAYGLVLEAVFENLRRPLLDAGLLDRPRRDR